MALFSSLKYEASPTDVGTGLIALCLGLLICRIFYVQYLHPLSKFPGPWYLSVSSLADALIATSRFETPYFQYLVRKYGTERPIRIGPRFLLFPRPSAIKDIYWEPRCNQKSTSYGTGVIGPPHLFSTLEPNEHRALRKALSNAPWTIGQLKKTWESRFDDHITFFMHKLNEHANANRVVCVSDKLCQFAGDIMSMISFSEPFGFVKNQRDEKAILENFRKGMDAFSFVGRWRFLREEVLRLPFIANMLLPSEKDTSGLGWLIGEAHRQVERRERQNAEGLEGKADFLQHCLDARFSDGTPLSPVQKLAHVNLLIQAGADTTGSSLGSTLRSLLLTKPAFVRARAEIDNADRAGLLSHPIQYEETRRHLPFFVAVIKEGMRLHPPTSNVPARVVPPGGLVIDGHFVPGGTDVTSHAYTVQRDRDTYGDDADEFRPERWLESEKKALEYDAGQMLFGAGFRVCLGKDVAIMELYKVLPEIVRRFDIEVVDPGRHIITGGAAWNVGFMGKFIAREM